MVQTWTKKSSRILKCPYPPTPIKKWHIICSSGWTLLNSLLFLCSSRILQCRIFSVVQHGPRTSVTSLSVSWPWSMLFATRRVGRCGPVSMRAMGKGTLPTKYLQLVRAKMHRITMQGLGVIGKRLAKVCIQSTAIDAFPIRSKQVQCKVLKYIWHITCQD